MCVKKMQKLRYTAQNADYYHDKKVFQKQVMHAGNRKM